jgi:hypothetical protein
MDVAAKKHQHVDAMPMLSVCQAGSLAMLLAVEAVIV